MNCVEVTHLFQDSSSGFEDITDRLQASHSLDPNAAIEVAWDTDSNGFQDITVEVEGLGGDLTHFFRPTVATTTPRRRHPKAGEGSPLDSRAITPMSTPSWTYVEEPSSSSSAIELSSRNEWVEIPLDHPPTSTSSSGFLNWISGIFAWIASLFNCFSSLEGREITPE